MSTLWKELHVNALQYKGTDDSIFLQRFKKKIPKYTTGCSCREFWATWTRANPPTYGPNNEYFDWTVKAHNAANVKLGKQEITFEDALELYKNYNCL